ncbi:hypothetical protein BWI86_27505 (plasmid) [Escherichia coli]|nr:hypothetical protein BWI86_27505 [Escherichia coli]
MIEMQMYTAKDDGERLAMMQVQMDKRKPRNAPPERTGRYRPSELTSRRNMQLARMLRLLPLN